MNRIRPRSHLGPVSYMTKIEWSNHQRMGRTGARRLRSVGRVGWSRGASFPSGVEPARRRFVKAFSMRIAFWPSSWPQALTQNRRGCGIRSEVGRPPGNRPIMTDPNRAVQSHAAAGQTSGSNLTPEALRLRQVRRAAAGFNHALQRTRPSRPGCNRCVPCAGSLSLGR